MTVALLRKLEQQLQEESSSYETLLSYYEGAKRLQAMGLSLPPEMRQLELVLNWCGAYLDELEARLDIDGFRLAGSYLADTLLHQWWQYNNMDEESSLAHLDAFIYGKAYILVSANDDPSQPPLIHVESARCMTHITDPRTRKITSAARFLDPDNQGHATEATLYLPDRTEYYSYKAGGWAKQGGAVNHKLGRVPVSPLVNRQRLQKRCGVTEMRDVMDLTDAACRSLLVLQGGQELLGVPARYVLGASPEDFKGPDGTQRSAWEAYLGRFLALKNDSAQVGSLPAADLRNFSEVVRLYAQLVVSVTGMPATYLGLAPDSNPTSAEGIYAEEARFVKRAERKCQAFSGTWEDVMRLAMLVTGRSNEDASTLETIWRDPSTPTKSAQAQQAVELKREGILPLEAVWELLGYGPEKRRQLRALVASDPAAQFLELMARDADRISGSNGGSTPDAV